MRLFINDNFIHIQDNRFIRLKRSCYLLPEEFFLTGKEVCPSGILGFLLIHPLHRIGSDFHHSHKREMSRNIIRLDATNRIGKHFESLIKTTLKGSVLHCLKLPPSMVHPQHIKFQKLIVKF